MWDLTVHKSLAHRSPGLITGISRDPSDPLASFAAALQGEGMQAALRRLELLILRCG